MRIVGGIYKGRVFSPGKKFKARPTTDLAKEALFNILDNRGYIEGLKVADLFSGTGSIGYEFISHGADHVTFVEKNRQHLQFIHKVLNHLKTDRATVIHADVFSFLKSYNSTFDLVFADPPFDMPNIEDLPDTLFSTEILKKEGLFILEHPATVNFKHHPFFTEHRKYGKVNFSFFQRVRSE